MKRPFTEVEMRKSVSRLKNNKSTGIDDISAELINTALRLYTNKLQTFLIKWQKLATPQMKL